MKSFNVLPKELSHRSSVSELSVELLAAEDKLSQPRCGRKRIFPGGGADMRKDRSPIKGRAS